MSEALPTCGQETCKATGACICSAALPAGPTLLDSPGFQSMSLFGPEAVLASPSRQRASGKGRKTSATSGPRCSGSSASVALGSSLVSRCQELLGSAGSMEYSQTWKEKVTPAGRLYWAHTASARRISGSDCSGWPTPESSDATGGRVSKEVGGTRPSGAKRAVTLGTAASLAGWPTPEAQEFEHADIDNLMGRREKIKAQGINGNGFGLTLGMAAHLAQSSEPSSMSADTGQDAREHEKAITPKPAPVASGTIAGWVTPSVFDATNQNTPETWAARNERNENTGGKTPAKDLAVQSQLAGWQSPTSGDAKGRTYQYDNHDKDRPRLSNEGLLRGMPVTSSPAETASGDASQPRVKQVLNPAFSLWLMGFPPSWMECGTRACLSIRSRPRKSKAG